MSGFSHWQLDGSAPELYERYLLRSAAFEKVRVDTVVQRIAFPSVLDYVRFQLLVTPMAALLGDRPESERQGLIEKVASEVADLPDAAMLEGGRFSFPQEAYVGTARARDRSAASETSARAFRAGVADLIHNIVQFWDGVVGAGACG